MKKYMQIEYEAIKKLIDGCGDQYDETVDFLEKTNGRIVFMGVGKSAHIGEKLASTFASLGLPSFFVHSTEAMHGDLGMLTPNDVAILISNSGSTKEVVQNILPLRRNGVKTVAFTSRGDSILARECDYRIIYPALKEADELNLAPTVSSTLTLVLGDAIACELSARKNFTKENFFAYHPNGALGDKLSREVR